MRSPGFAITADAYNYFVERAGIKEKIMEILKSVNYDDPSSLEEASRRIRQLVELADFPEDLRREIVEAYRRLGEIVGVKDPYVATRSSGTFEDIATASFAGQHETYLYVRGEEELLRHVKKCFSSLYTPRAIFYKHEKGIPFEKEALSVGVQVMVDPRAAGVMFTLDPLTGDRRYVVIEGAWGAGEAIVQGKVTPDHFKVDKETLEIVEKRVSRKEFKLVRNPERVGELREVALSEEEANRPCLTDEQVVELAKLGKRIEQLYGGKPQDIEWVLNERDGRIYIVQSRPETVWSQREERVERREEARPEEYEVLVRGLGASPGIVTGRARVILDVSRLSEFQEGEILVTRMTTPDWVPAMRKAAAIVTDGGGMTAHAAIVSRELGIPCVVGTRNATKVIKTGMVITVDGEKGLVYRGEVRPVVKRPPEAVAPRPAYEVPITATKIYMNLGVPDKIEEYKDLPFDGIGLMRIEFIIAEWIKKHPLALIEEGKADLFVEKLAEGIAMVARAVYPRPVVVRLSDFKTTIRCSASGESAGTYPSSTSRPSGWSLGPSRSAVEIMKEEGLERSRDLKIWLMAEVPSIVFLAEEFAKLCDGFSIGSNDLTSLILGVDRDSAILGELGYFDERDPAVLEAVKMLIEKAHKHGVTVSICGQAPSVYPEFTEFLIRAGIDSISVNPDAVVETRKLVAAIERKIMLERLSHI